MDALPAGCDGCAPMLEGVDGSDDEFYPKGGRGFIVHTCS